MFLFYRMYLYFYFFLDLKLNKKRKRIIFTEYMNNIYMNRYLLSIYWDTNFTKYVFAEDLLLSICYECLREI